MEMETSTMSPDAQRLIVEEDALASQVLEIIGGITLEALQSLEEPEDRDVWSMEEGDDSVFYSDEDPAQRDTRAKTSDEAIPLTEDDPGEEEESIMDKGDSETGKELTQQAITTEREEERQELRTPTTEPSDRSDPADPGAQSDPEESASTCGESPQLNCTIANVQTQPEQNISAEQANLPVVEEEVVLDAETPSLEPFDVTNEERCTRLKGEAEAPELMFSAAELQVSGGGQLQVNQEPEWDDRSSHVPAGFHQIPSPGYSTLPLPKRKSFNHLASSAYSTVSYRKIRRGNTRQKIEEFEYMLMNL